MVLKPRFIHRGIIVVTLAMVFGLGSPLQAASDPAELLPADTFLVVRVSNVNDIRAKFKKLSAYGLYKEPAMQQFIRPVEKKIRELIDEKLKEAWEEIGMENPPEKLPIPEGQVTMGMRMLVKKVMRRTIVDWNDDGPIYKMVEVEEPTPEIIVLAEMGESMEAAKAIITKAVEKAVDKGSKRAEETIRGVKVITLSEPRKNDDDDDAPVSNSDPLIYAIKGKTIILSSSMDMMKHVLVRMSGGEVGNLADDAGYRRVTKKLGPADVTFFISGKAIVNLIKASSGTDEAGEMDKVIRALGLDNFVGLGATISIAPKPTEEMKLKLFACTRGEKRGILAMLAPQSMSTKPNKLLTKGLSAFFVANYDFGKIFDQIAVITLAINGQDINKGAQDAMVMTGGKPGEEGGKPPVNLRKDVLAQMSGPVVVTNRIDKPFTDADSSKTLLAVGARDRVVLDTALGRIHDAFIAQGDKDLRRELRNITMYMMPGSPLAMMVPFPMGGGREMSAFAVPGNHFVFGSVGIVEQFIRSLNRKNVQNIATDPMYQYASRYLPAQASMFFYQNGQISTEAAWVQVKEAAKKQAAKAKDDQSDDEFEMHVSGNPMFTMVEGLKEHCDFTMLPDFSAVKKYFGPSVGYIIGVEDGIYGEITSLKAPPAK